MRRTAIGIDVDGVLADSISKWLQEAEKLYGIKALKKDIVRYELSEVFTTLTRRQVMDTWESMWDDYHESIMLENESIPSIMEGLHEKFDIVITTSNPSRSIKGWLKSNGIVYDGYVRFDNHLEKHRLDGVRVYVDDFHEVAESVATAGKTAIVLRQPWNEEFIRQNTNPNILLANNWHEIEDILMSMPR